MTEPFATWVTAAATIAAALSGGVYFAFSTIVSPALRLRPAGEAVAVMQRVNETAQRAPFMIVFFGGALAAGAAGVTALISGADSWTVAVRVIGASLTLASFVTTIVFNVPRNRALARIRPTPEDADAAWRSFDTGWSLANKVRAVLAIVGSAFLAV
jgi:uncharacterized membrane protein